MESKGWLQSKTMWFNIFSIVAGGAGYLSDALSSHPTFVCVLVILQAVGNLILRKMTVKPVAGVK